MQPAPSTPAASKSPWAQRAPAPNATITPDHGGAFAWLWLKHGALAAVQLEAALDAAAVPAVSRFCQLCQRSPSASETLVDHLLKDAGHLAQVQARFSQEGPAGRGWVQSWPGGPQLNHLTLEVITSAACSEVSTAASSSEAGSPPPQPTAQTDSACPDFEAALRPGTAEKRATEGIMESAAAGATEVAAPAAATKAAEKVAEESDEWQAFTDPESGGVWYYNARTGEASWTKPSSSAPAAQEGGRGGDFCNEHVGRGPAQETTEWL